MDALIRKQLTHIQFNSFAKKMLCPPKEEHVLSLRLSISASYYKWSENLLFTCLTCLRCILPPSNVVAVATTVWYIHVKFMSLQSLSGQSIFFFSVLISVPLVCGLGSENRSVVLASTAIQLLDERKSPIAAGKWKFKCFFLSVSFTQTLFNTDRDCGILFLTLLCFIFLRYSCPPPCLFSSETLAAHMFWLSMCFHVFNCIRCSALHSSAQNMYQHA